MSWTITRGHLARFFGTKEAVFVTLIQPSFFRHPFSTPKMCFMHILPFVALVSHFYLNCITTIHTNAHFFQVSADTLADSISPEFSSVELCSNTGSGLIPVH